MAVFKMPTKYFLVSGTAEGITELNSFDNALINAGVGDTNLVRLSSILPPRCREIDPIKLPEGSLVPIAYSKITSSRPGEVISAAVAIGIPEDENLAGLIMEYAAREPLEVVERKVKEMVREGFSFRGKKLKEIKSIGATIKVKRIATAFAGVVLWD
ncbi:MAG: arginine decarboxylase, pyruvoyl-dependent [Candidatus Neomarinimicrobiota bacterium]|nr:MAG: arginine decarboxylase, pyruvoyl-dependent [Candidatus Neomarinimicrobiota bacterium]